VELKNAFISLGFGGQNKFVLRILHDYDTDGNQGIDFGEFIKLSTARFGQSVTKADVERVFKHFDMNKSVIF
jgi:Ca2+-binding EF-hand superfamily protein